MVKFSFVRWKPTIQYRYRRADQDMCGDTGLSLEGDRERCAKADHAD